MSANYRGEWLRILPQETKDIIRQLLENDLRIRSEQPALIYPCHEEILRVFDMAPPQNIKAVILGQDPYHGPNQAMGLAFSVHKGTPIPPSLQNMFKEYCADLGHPMPTSGDLTPWAQQGVLLLNTVLTVPQGCANGHANLGWQAVTTAILQAVLQQPNPTVFLLWGRQAQTTFELAQTSGHTGHHELAPTLRSTHPSPLSAMRPAGTTPAFMGSKPFSRANDLLMRVGMGCTPIDWTLP